MHIFVVNFGVIFKLLLTKLRWKTNVFWWNLKVLFNCIESVAKGMCQTRQFANHGLWLLICCHLAFPALFLFLSISVTLQAFITTRFVELIYRIFFWRFCCCCWNAFWCKIRKCLAAIFFLNWSGSGCLDS